MTPFREDLSAIFDDVLAESAEILRAGSDWSGIRVIARMPDAVQGFGQGRFVSDSLVLLVPVEDADAIAPGDLITFRGVTRVVIGEPLRDERQLWWRVETRAQ